MKSKTHPDRSAEASRVRDELSHDESALRALDAVAREEQPDVPLPPIPAGRREQWKDRYGEATRTAVIPEKRSWFDRIPSFWGVGSAAVLAAVAIFFALKTGGPAPQETTNPFDPALLRDYAQFTPTPDTVTIFIPSTTISFETMAQTRKSGRLLEATDQNDVQRVFMENNLKSAVILDANTGMISLIPGISGEEIQLIEDPAKADEYDFSEALDDFLKQ